MNNFRAKSEKVLTLLAESPAFFFFPYLLLYLAGWFLQAPIAVVEKGFWLFHFINFAAIFFLIRTSWREVKPSEWLFWGGLFLLLWNRGAYLEYPSDPWDHFRRLTLWNDYSFIADNPFKNRITYFFGWTFLKYFSPLHQRSFLNFYSACWQWLFCYQFARFFLKVPLERRMIIPLVLGTLVFFGSGMMSFRYYMLSGVPLGYIAYLSALAIFLETPFKIQLKKVAPLLILSALMVFSHPETFLFLMISFCALQVSRLGFEGGQRRSVHLLFLSLYTLSLVGGYLLYRYHQFPFSQYAYSPIWTAQLSKFSTFRIWDLNGKIFETLALPGAITLFLSAFLLKKHPRLVLLSVFPVFLLLFPPVVLLIVKTFHFDTAYRVLYSFPISILLVLLLEKALEKIGCKERYIPFLLCLLLLFLAAPYQYPWRGRLFFQVHRPKPVRTLQNLDETAEWFFNNRRQMPRECHILSDDLSLFSLYTHLGRRKFDFDRPAPLHFLKNNNITSADILDKYLGITSQGRTLCGVLIARKSEIPPPPYSIISIEGRLWPPQRADLNEYLSDEISPVASKLLKRAWTKIEVPPFYDLYEPPYLSDLPPPIFYPKEN